MNNIIKELILETTSDNLQTRHSALEKIALLFEKHSPRRHKPGYYERRLSPELLSLSLSEDELNEMVHEIGHIVLSDKVTGALVETLANSSSIDAFEYLLTYVCRESSQYDEMGIWQALIGIRIFIYVQQNDPIHNQVFELVRKYNLKDNLKRIEQNTGEDLKNTIISINQKLS